MRIPVYASQAKATNEAPGASIRARMDPNVFVQSELAKGEVLGSAFEQINKYALARAEAEAKIQYNEAMLGAEVEMRDLAESLKESSRLGDVLNDKGTGAWQVATKDMRARLADGLSSRSMTDAFNARFDQQEVTVRFQLRDAVETRINARAAAASAARQDSVVAQLSDPRMDPATAAMLLASSDAEMQRDLAAGIVTPDMAANINSAMVNKVADNLVSGFVGSDPAKGLALVRTLQLQDEVNAGTITAEEAAALSGLDASSAYTLSVLRLATPEVANKAITEAIKNASTIDNALDEFVAEGKAAVTAQNGDLFNSAFGVSVTAPASVDLTARLQAVAPEALALAGIDPTQPISGKQYIDLATRLLDTRNALTPADRKSLDTHKNPDTVGPFASETNSSVYATLVDKANTGNLTIDALSAAKGDLTLQAWETLTATIQSEADESFKAIDDQVAAQFKYNKISGATDAASKEAEAAYAFVSSRLLAETILRKSEGNPMTRIEVSAFAKSLVDDRMVTYRAVIKEDLAQYIESQRSKGIPSLTPGNEIAELDAWYNSLPEPTNGQTSVYSGVRKEINVMLSRMRD